MGFNRAGAEGSSFRDDFDSSRWIKSSHKQSELATFDPHNVVVDNGDLRLRIPAGTTGNAEIESMDFYGYGSYRARMKMADAPSSITGYFLYITQDTGTPQMDRRRSVRGCRRIV